MTQCMPIIKMRTTNILCMHSFIVCNKNQEKEHEKNEEKRTKVNLMLWHVNPTFLLIEPYPFRHIHCTFTNLLLMWRKVQFKASNLFQICLKLVPRILDLGPPSNMTLKLLQSIPQTLNLEPKVLYFGDKQTKAM